MTKKSKVKRKIISICLIASLGSAAILGGTLAYYTDKEQAKNSFTTGALDISLSEKIALVTSNITIDDVTGNVVEQYDYDDLDLTTVTDTDKNGILGGKYKEVMPGDQMVKKVTVKNEETEPAYVAVTVKQTNYGDPDITTDSDGDGKKNNDGWNQLIDDYYESSTYKASDKGPVGPYYIHDDTKDEARRTFMNDLTRKIWTGTAWAGMDYTKEGDGGSNRVRYYLNGKADGTIADLSKPGNQQESGNYSYSGNEVKLIAVDYQTCGSTEKSSYQDNMMPLDTYKMVEDEGSRVWVFYLYMPGETEKEFDLSITCPGELIDKNSLAAFQNMTLDVQAVAIQTKGFDNAKAAFTALNKTHPIADWSVDYKAEDIEDAKEITTPNT